MRAAIFVGALSVFVGALSVLRCTTGQTGSMRVVRRGLIFSLMLSESAALLFFVQNNENVPIIGVFYMRPCRLVRERKKTRLGVCGLGLVSSFINFFASQEAAPPLAQTNHPRPSLWNYIPSPHRHLRSTPLDQ
jgi:hypothetical protein